MKYKLNRTTYQTPIIGSASFPLRINNGNNIEKTHPLKSKNGIPCYSCTKPTMNSTFH